MTNATPISARPPAHAADKAITLALRLAHAENALQAFTAGQVDAIIDPSGRTYLLRGAQENLRRSEVRLQTLLDSAPDLLTVINRGGEIVSQSTAAIRLLGVEPGSLVGKSFFDLVHPDDIPRFSSAFFNVLEEFRRDATVEFRCRTANGEYRTLEAAVSKLRDVTVASIVLSCRDTTRRRSAEEEAVLVEASLVKRRSLSDLSHELGTPLASALLGLERLEEDERFAESRSTITTIRRNIERQLRLLDELITKHAVTGACNACPENRPKGN